MTPPTVRDARAEDAAVIVDLIETVAGEGMWIGHEAPVDRAALTATTLEGIASPDSHHLVAEHGGEVVGHLSATDRRGRVSFGMYVAPDVRGRRLGYALLIGLIDWARRRGAHKVHLEVWPHNAAAIALYARAGFVVEGRRVRQYRRRSGELWDSLLMGLVLDVSAPGSSIPDALGDAEQQHQAEGHDGEEDLHDR